MPKMHEDEFELDEPLVRALIEEQFPAWAGLTLVRVEPSGTDNAIFRLGNELAVRLPRRDGSLAAEDKEHTWLPRLAPRLPVEIPLPVARGKPGAGYPWHWSVHSWLEGEVPIGKPLAADELATFVDARNGSIRAEHPSRGPVAASRLRCETARSVTRSSASMPPERASSGTGQRRRRNGRGNACGCTRTSTRGTSSLGTVG